MIYTSRINTNMETKARPSFWWMKPTSKVLPDPIAAENITSTPKADLDISSSLAEFLEKEQKVESEAFTDVDIDSILEEINRVAAQSPLGPYEKVPEERSVEDIMKEAERIFMESSKSFEQLSSRSKTSQNVTDINSRSSDQSTPTPKSVSPLPLDNQIEQAITKDSEADSYTEDFSYESRNASPDLPDERKDRNDLNVSVAKNSFSINVSDDKEVENNSEQYRVEEKVKEVEEDANKLDGTFVVTEEVSHREQLKDDVRRNEALHILELDNERLRKDVHVMQVRFTYIFLNAIF